jgi:hypothetical protein
MSLMPQILQTLQSLTYIHKSRMSVLPDPRWDLEANLGKCNEKYERLKKEHQNLQKERQDLLNRAAERESHILTLQPGPTEFGRDDAEKVSDALCLRINQAKSCDQGFRQVMRGINVWVLKWTDAYYDDQQILRNWKGAFNHFSHTGREFGEFLSVNKDISSTIGYPDSDQELMTACVIRFVSRRIFSGTPSGISSDMAEVLQTIEQALPLCTAPKLSKPRDFQSPFLKVIKTNSPHPRYADYTILACSTKFRLFISPFGKLFTPIRHFLLRTPETHPQKSRFLTISGNF